MTEKFQSIESKINKPLTWLLTGLMWIMVFLIMVIIAVVFENIYQNFGSSVKNDITIMGFLIFAQIILILCCLALIKGLMYKRKRKVRKIVINENGAFFYNYRNEVTATVLYDDLHPALNAPADVYIYSTQTLKYSKTILQIYLKNESGKMIPSAVDFNFELMILSNQFELYRHFLKGIQYFRPDLRIASQTMDQYYLTPDKPSRKELGIFEYVMIFIFLTAGAGLLYLFTLLFKIIIC
ncbi:hypothetical protein [Chryseobacterium aureum]|uniref:hypothetical protein n=1 Tax=Chryseobacterium aureum TaxID=2497456 RepID=UPI000F876757|nr:hypothetical protein [Chryseobacterium aureum]